MKDFFMVYLAGPITGLSYDGATDWRNTIADKMLKHHSIVGLSPMRNKDYLLEVTSLGDTYDEKIMSSQRGITARDRFDCTRADAVLFNLLGAEQVSIGTVMEVAWADAHRIPAVLVMEKEGNPHEHAMLRECCPFRTDCLEEGLETIVRILKPW